MQLISANRVFEWIENGREKLRSVSEGQPHEVRVRHLIPPVFPKYAKILHRLDAHYENIDNPLSDEEIKLLNIPRCTVVTDFICRHRRESADSRLRWKQLAQLLHVPFRQEINHEWFAERLRPHSACWPRFIWGPAEGNLDAEGTRELVGVLVDSTSPQECFFRFAEIPFLGMQTPLLHGRLEELQSALAEHGYQFTPEYWWPSDRSWCVCSDYDLAFTVVGGESNLIDNILLSEVIECLEVDADTRVDSLVPLPVD